MFLVNLFKIYICPAAGQPLRAHPGLVHVNAIGDLDNLFDM